MLLIRHWESGCRLERQSWAVGLVMLLLLVFLPNLASAAVSQGILSVTCGVPGALVFVDGEEVGKVPLTRFLPAGSHQVRIVADNFDPYVRKVDVSPDLTTRVDATLMAGKGTVEFFAKPSGAKAYVDDQEVGPTPIRIREIQSGKHEYRIEAPGHETVHGQFNFTVGKNLLIREELRSSAGLFYIETDPPDATVFMDGWEVGTTPLEMDDIPSGLHHVRLALDGYADVFRTVDTSDGSKGEIHALFAERGAALRVRTGEKGASVFLDGNLMGNGRRVRLKAVERGDFAVSVEADGKYTAQKTIIIPPTGRVLMKARLERAEGLKMSELVQQKPIYQRWTFWTATAVVAAGATTGGYLFYLSTFPEEQPEGDVEVVIP